MSVCKLETVTQRFEAEKTPDSNPDKDVLAVQQLAAIAVEIILARWNLICSKCFDHVPKKSSPELTQMMEDKVQRWSEVWEMQRKNMEVVESSIDVTERLPKTRDLFNELQKYFKEGADAK